MAARRRTAKAWSQAGQAGEGEGRETRFEAHFDPHFPGSEELREEVELGAVPIVDAARSEGWRQGYGLPAVKAPERPLWRLKGAAELGQGGSDGGLSFRIAVADEEGDARPIDGGQAAGSEDRQGSRNPGQGGAADGGGQAALAEFRIAGAQPGRPSAVVRDVHVVDPGGEAGLGQGKGHGRERSRAVDGDAGSGQSALDGRGIVDVRHDIRPCRVPSRGPHREARRGERPGGVDPEGAVASEEDDHRRARATRTVQRL